MQEKEMNQQSISGSIHQFASQAARDTYDTQLISVLTEHEDMLNTLRREFRGEHLFQDSKGNIQWVQVDKPMFTKLDKNNKPKRIFNKKTKRWQYIANDDAINDIIKILKSSGLNSITPLTVISEDEIRADLLEIESKIAVLLTVKRKSWGIDKSEYPIIVANLKTIIKDARYRAKDGTVLKALRTITSRQESSLEDHRDPRVIRESVRGAGLR